MSGRARSKFLVLATVAACAVNLALLAGPTLLAELLPSSTERASSATSKPQSKAPSPAPGSGPHESGQKPPSLKADPASKEPQADASSTTVSGTVSATNDAGEKETARGPASTGKGKSADDAKAATSLKSAGDGKDAGDEKPPGEESDGAAHADAAATAEAEKTFRRIVQAYENMEPVNASAALVRLAERDLPSTVRTLMAMNPRKTGAVLDAMSAKSPEMAAMITDEMIALATPSSLTPAR